MEISYFCQVVIVLCEKYTVLVVEDDVWSPHSVVGQPDRFYVSKVGEVPGEMSVEPFLKSGVK